MSTSDHDRLRGLDAYEVRARLIPAIASVAPVLPLAIVGFGLDGRWLVGVLGAAVPVAVGVVAAAFAREAGIRVQERLWGPESVSAVVELLRWRGARSRAEADQLHRTVTEATSVDLPTEESERADPREADGRYRVAETELRRAAAGVDHPGLTRAVTQYGMLRNLRGLRTVCIVSSVVAIVAGVSTAIAGDELLAVGIGIAAFGVAYIAVVLWLIDDRSVRSAADTYARALIDAVVG